ncbi:conserved protein of unknown function [Georgfuchsia toluolica]|uniref:Uncharacterized protein n=1 Tax=Georgfuchsia toluolica TaxID=424218 RepID=A0A916J7U2_9PROT|nr:hypothetical protein [Georgfuchsia toluolica]CAG4884775.1 conserved protein of unknown function [Georgfuchsia toluolica]
MELRPALQIKTVIKAMTDVVLPAVAADNKLAQEQVRLVIGMLHLVAQRLPLMYRYDRDELLRFLALAETLKSQAKGLPGADEAMYALSTSVEVGEDVLERARAEPSELEAANFDLREKIGALIMAIYATNDMAKLTHISSSVTTHAKGQLLRERSWLITQGWEPDPKAIPAIETLIGERPGTRS